MDKSKKTEKDTEKKDEGVVTSMRVRKPVQRLEMNVVPVKTKEKVQIPKVIIVIFIILYNINE